MEHPQIDNSSIRGLLLTISLWAFAHVTASQFATYCTIVSAIITIIVNMKKLFKKNN